MPTPFTAEQFSSAHKAQIENLFNLVNVTFSGVERLAALNLTTARNAFEESAGSVRALLGAKDIQEFIAIQGSLVQPAVDKAANWSRSAYEISSATHEEISKTLEGQIAEAAQVVDTALDELVKNAPAGADAAVSASVNAVKSALSAANTAYETLSKSAKQFSESAGSSVSSAAPKAARPKKS